MLLHIFLTNTNAWKVPLLTYYGILAFPSALRCLEFQHFWAWEHRIGEYSSPKGRFVINNYCIVANGWAVIISASVNGIDNCRPHCIAYMANYITPTDPLSQRTCRTVGVHTTRARPIYMYRGMEKAMAAFLKPLSKTRRNIAELRITEENKQASNTWEW